MAARLTSRLELPREHGAWGMLAVSCLVGVLAAGRPTEGSLWVALAALGAFSARESLLRAWRTRRRGRRAPDAERLVLAKGGLALLAGAMLLGRLGLWSLLAPALLAVALGLVHLRQALAGEERSLPGQLVAILGITLTAPAAHIATLGRATPVALLIWGLCVAYFTSGVFYLKVRIGTAHPKQPGLLRVRRIQCAVYHLALALLVASLAWGTPLGPALALAYLAAVARALWFLWRPRRDLPLRRIGWTEVGYSLLFLVFVVAALRPLQTPLA